MKHFLWRVFSSVRVCVVIWWGLQRRGYVVFFFFALFIERNWRELRVCVRSLDGTGAFMEGFCTENLFFFILIYKRGKSLPKKWRWGVEYFCTFGLPASSQWHSVKNKEIPPNSIYVTLLQISILPIFTLFRYGGISFGVAGNFKTCEFFQIFWVIWISPYQKLWLSP